MSGFISALLLLSVNLSGQSAAQAGQALEQEQEAEARIRPGERIRGPRIGYDIGGLILLYAEPERSIHTFYIDYEIVQDIYPVLEFGFQQSRIGRDTYRYRSHGMFARIGADVNLLQYDHHFVYEMFYAGFRYGLAYFVHQAEGIRIPDGYYGDLDGLNLGKNQLNAHWISVNTGIRVELFRNVFMGWNVLFSLKLAQVKDSNMQPYNIPGFGNGSRKVTLNINYTLAYRIPLSGYRPRKVIRIGERR